MTPDLWVPGLVVLAVGALVGWWFARRKPAAKAAAAGGRKRRQGAVDSLETEDLRHRRDELYARLRAEGLETEERTALELEAASVLQRLDRVEGGVAPHAQKGDAEAASDSSAVASAPAPSRARTLLTGFAFGGGTAALIALLVFWAGRDAKESEVMPSGGSVQAGRSGAEEPHPMGSLAPEVAGEVNEILERLESVPDDLAARKRLALLYLGSDQYVPAFEQAGAVLAVQPDDIDSLYVQGVVRMTMGQDDMALVQLDRVLELFPEHARAMTVKGLVFARRGERDQARTMWTRALEVGGSQPQIENLLSLLDAEENQAASGAVTSPPLAAAGSAPVAPVAPIAPDEYRVRVEADVIPGFPQTGTLFVALRTGAGGPPIAVRRIDQPTFPMVVAVGPQDMMMAGDAALPEVGFLTVRLDQDGSVGTRGEDDLEGSADVTKGSEVTLRLE